MLPRSRPFQLPELEVTSRLWCEQPRVAAKYAAAGHCLSRAPMPGRRTNSKSCDSYSTTSSVTDLFRCTLTQKARATCHPMIGCIMRSARLLAWLQMFVCQQECTVRGALLGNIEGLQASCQQLDGVTRVSRQTDGCRSYCFCRRPRRRAEGQGPKGTREEDPQAIVDKSLDRISISQRLMEYVMLQHAQGSLATMSRDRPDGCS